MKDKDYDPVLMGAVKAVPPGWTSWDSITIKAPMTLKQLLDFFEKTYQVELTIISWG